MMRGTAEELAARAKSGELRVATIGTGDLFYTPSACVFSYKTGAADVIGFRFGVMAYEFRPRLERVLQRCGPQLPSTITDAFSHAKNELNRPVYNTQKQLRDSAVEAECHGDDEKENEVEVAGLAAPEMSGPQPLPDGSDEATPKSSDQPDPEAAQAVESDAEELPQIDLPDETKATEASGGGGGADRADPQPTELPGATKGSPAKEAAKEFQDKAASKLPYEPSRRSHSDRF